MKISNGTGGSEENPTSAGKPQARIRDRHPGWIPTGRSRFQAKFAIVAPTLLESSSLTKYPDDQRNQDAEQKASREGEIEPEILPFDANASGQSSKDGDFRDRPIQPLSHLSGPAFVTGYGRFRKPERPRGYNDRSVSGQFAVAISTRSTRHSWSINRTNRTPLASRRPSFPSWSARRVKGFVWLACDASLPPVNRAPGDSA